VGLLYSHCNFYISKEPLGSIQRSGKHFAHSSLSAQHTDYFAAFDLFKFVPGRSGLQWHLVEKISNMPQWKKTRFN
jgi:hypothetical protein